MLMALVMTPYLWVRQKWKEIEGNQLLREGEFAEILNI